MVQLQEIPNIMMPKLTIINRNIVAKISQSKPTYSVLIPVDSQNVFFKM